MALDPLATSADLPLAWRTNLDADKALAIASSAIRDAAGSAITATTGTVIVNGGRANLLTLPGPVRAVTSVLVDGNAVTDFEVLPNGLWRHCGWGHGPVPVSVTYTSGLDEVPPDIVDLCAQLAATWLQHQSEGGGSTAGLASVGLDDAREAYTTEAAGQISPVFIPQITRDWLRSRFGMGNAVVVETL